MMETLAAFIERHFLSCSFKSLLGMECPGCGMQRAFAALLRGDLQLSLSLNPSLIPFIITIIYASAHLLTGFRNGARNIVWFFSFTGLVMVVNFVIKLLSGH